MFKIICITNRHLCRDVPFPVQLKKVAAGHPDAIILREKDLSPEDYFLLARQAAAVCEEYQVLLIPHSFVSAAMALSSSRIHLPLPLLKSASKESLNAFSGIGASCHSTEEAAEAQKLGASYLIAGHIFPTECKKDLPPRGLEFLHQVCERVSVPVYALGGITAHSCKSIRQQGAQGVCLMSSLMESPDPAAIMKAIRQEVREA